MKACVWSHVVAKILVFQPRDHSQRGMMSTLWEEHRRSAGKADYCPTSQAVPQLEWQGRIIGTIQMIIRLCPSATKHSGVDLSPLKEHVMQLHIWGN